MRSCIFYINVGNLSKTKADELMDKWKDMIEKDFKRFGERWLFIPVTDQPTEIVMFEHNDRS